MAACGHWRLPVEQSETRAFVLKHYVRVRIWETYCILICCRQIHPTVRKHHEEMCRGRGGEREEEKVERVEGGEGQRGEGVHGNLHQLTGGQRWVPSCRNVSGHLWAVKKSTVCLSQTAFPTPPPRCPSPACCEGSKVRPPPCVWFRSLRQERTQMSTNIHFQLFYFLICELFAFKKTNKKLNSICSIFNHVIH